MFFDTKNDARRRPFSFNESRSAVNMKRKSGGMKLSVSSGSKRNGNGRRRSEQWRRPRGKSNTPMRSTQLECGVSHFTPYPPPRHENRTANPAKRTLGLSMTHVKATHVHGMTHLRGRAASRDPRAGVLAQPLRIASSLPKMSAHASAGTVGEVP